MADGSVFVTGYFTDSLIIQEDENTRTLESAGAWGSFVLKYDSDGLPAWTLPISGAGPNSLGTELHSRIAAEHVAQLDCQPTFPAGIEQLPKRPEVFACRFVHVHVQAALRTAHGGGD